MVNPLYKIYKSCILEPKIENRDRESSEIAICSAMGRLRYVKMKSDAE